MPDCEVEDTAWQYVSSAVGRRWNTTATGEQLTAQQVSAWNGVFSTVAESSRPAWQEDPLFLVAQQVYARHNTIVGFKAKKHDCSDEAELARGLVVLRNALYGDAKDGRGQLLRRQLAAQEVAKWDAHYPGVWGVAARSWLVPPRRSCWCRSTHMA